MSYENLEKKAKKIAIKRLNLEEKRISPEIGQKKSKWSPGLLRNIVNIEVRAAEKSILTRFDEKTEEIIGWRYPDRSIGSKDVKINKDEALDIAKSEVDIPHDAVFDSIDLLDRGSPGLIYYVKWNHYIDDIPVEGDFLSVKINPETKEIISVTKNWSVI